MPKENSLNKEGPEKKGFSRSRLLAIFLALGFGTGLFLLGTAWAREQGRRSACLNSLKQIGTAINIYASEHNEQPPSRLSDMTFFTENDNHKLLLCPSASQNLPPYYFRMLDDLKKQPKYIAYQWLSVTSSIGEALSATMTPIMSDKPQNHERWWCKYSSILFADGHVTGWPGTIEDYARSKSLVITVNMNWMD